MSLAIHITEAQYVDPRAGNDKFYRTYVMGSSWVTQYGRNDTIGTFTKLVEAGSEDAASKAAAAKFISKVKKGYVPTRAGSLALDRPIGADDLALLDDLVRRLPDSSDEAAAGVIREPVAAVDLGPVVLPDLTGTVESALAAAVAGSAPDPVARVELPLRPMLAATLSQDSLDGIMNSAAWVTQFKYDGDRVLIEVGNGSIRVLNRQGESKTRNVGHAHLLPFTALHRGRWVFDGEVVGRTLVLFDLVSASASRTWVKGENSFTSRYSALQVIAEALAIPAADNLTESPVVLAPVCSSSETKTQMLADAVVQQREGIIARRADGVYEQGRRSSSLLKHKLVKDVDVVISDLHATKESATLSVHDDAGRLVEVGSASTLGKGAVCVGEVWVVTFLYVTDPSHPRLVQPRLVRPRSDKTAAQCQLDQFIEAGTNRIV